MTGWRRGLIGISTVLGVLLVELKQTWLVAQLCTTAGSMLVSLVIYGYAFGWYFAAGFIFLLLAHEWGHILAIKVFGLGSRGPLFIPFVGAVVQLRQLPRSVRCDAGIALAGPALGTLSALLCLISYLWTDQKMWLVFSYTGCLLNLFNLIPINPLDGGRIAPAISTKLWLLGLIVLGWIFFKTHNPFLLIILVVAVLRITDNTTEDLPDEYFFVPTFVRFKVALWYFTILGVLSVATIFTHQLLY